MTKKQRRVDSFFTRTVSPRIDEDATIEEENEEPVRDDENPPSIPVAENATFSTIQRDPGVRQPIWTYPVNKRDEIRRAYLNYGPHRLVLPKYSLTGPKTHPHRFQAKWYSEYPWLEYSRTTDRAYCFYCYLFLEEPSTNKGQDAFAINGFKNWNRVKGKHCSFMKHVGDGPNSQHNNAVRFCDALLNQAGHIDQVMQRVTDEEVRLNRLKVKATIDLVRLCSFQGISFRGRDERVGSKNRGNLLEILNLVGSYNEELQSIVSDSPGNAKYTSPDIQKELLNYFAEKVRKKVVEDIGNSKF